MMVLKANRLVEAISGKCIEREEKGTKLTFEGASRLRRSQQGGRRKLRKVWNHESREVEREQYFIKEGMDKQVLRGCIMEDIFDLDNGRVLGGLGTEAREE